MTQTEILLMEDDPALSELYQRRLRRAGYGVTAASDGVAGLQLLTEGRYDLIVLDYKMPEMDGLQVLEHLQGRIAPPVLMLSGVPDVDVVVRAMQLGADDYVLKDLDDESAGLLLDAIDKTLERGRLRVALAASEHQVLRGEGRFRAMTEATSDLIVIFDRRHRITYATPYFQQFTGITDKEYYGTSPRRFMDPRDMAQMIASAEIAWAHPGETVVAPDFRGFDHTGRGHHFSARLTALPDTPGIEGLVANCRDITKRKRAEKALLREKARTEQYLNTAGSLILALGPSGDIRLINRFGCRVLGYEELEIKGAFWQERCVHGADQELFAGLFARVFDGDHEGLDGIEFRVCTKSGEERMFSWSAQPMVEGRWVTQVLLCGVDITERKRAQAALAQSEERYALATRAAKVGVWDWDIRTGEMYIDPQLKEVLGYRSDELADRPEIWRACIHEQDRDAVWEAIQRCLSLEQGSVEAEHRMRCRDDSVRWFITRANVGKDADGNAVRLIGTNTDITDLKQAEMHIEHMATHDFLTGLPNRLLLLDRLRIALAAARRAEDMVAVLFLDLDGFKPVNDRYGHDAGDEVLRQIAHRLRSTFRASDTVARYGGDEFVMVLSGLHDAETAAEMAHKVLSVLADDVVIGEDGLSVRLGGSIGISLYPHDGTTPETVVKSADDAMYLAKRAGKTQFAFSRQVAHYRRSPEELRGLV